MTTYRIEKTPSKNIGIYKNGTLIFDSGLPVLVENKINNELDKMNKLGLKVKVVNKVTAVVIGK